MAMPRSLALKTAEDPGRDEVAAEKIDLRRPVLLAAGSFKLAQNAKTNTTHQQKLFCESSAVRFYAKVQRQQQQQQQQQ